MKMEMIVSRAQCQDRWQADFVLLNEEMGVHHCDWAIRRREQLTNLFSCRHSWIPQHIGGGPSGKTGCSATFVVTVPEPVGS